MVSFVIKVPACHMQPAWMEKGIGDRHFQFRLLRFSLCDDAFIYETYFSLLIAMLDHKDMKRIGAGKFRNLVG